MILLSGGGAFNSEQSSGILDAHYSALVARNSQSAFGPFRAEFRRLLRLVFGLSRKRYAIIECAPKKFNDRNSRPVAVSRPSSYGPVPAVWLHLNQRQVRQAHEPPWTSASGSFPPAAIIRTLLTCISDTSWTAEKPEGRDGVKADRL